jgi:3-phytase
LRSRATILAASAAVALATGAVAQVATVTVPALRETAAVASARDAADDPAIWRNPKALAASLIVATDKQAGLNVYGLDGKLRSQLPAGRVNNVDLRGGVEIAGKPGVLVAASDRTDLANGKVALFRLETASARLVPLGSLRIGAGEAYGFCLWRRKADGALFAFNVMKDGRIIQARLDVSGAEPRVDLVRTVKLATQSEGCVADDRTGILYVAEEDVGVWRLGADPASVAKPTMFAPVDGVRLFADAEGIAIAPRGATAGELVVSSQGDSAYAVYNLEDGAFAGRFRIGPGAKGVDGASETDGVEIALGAFGPAFPEGVMIAQDGDNAPEAQDFKLISWADVRRALRLP